jgi:hypothetical protein
MKSLQILTIDHVTDFQCWGPVWSGGAPNGESMSAPPENPPGKRKLFGPPRPAKTGSLEGIERKKGPVAMLPGQSRDGEIAVNSEFAGLDLVQTRFCLEALRSVAEFGISLQAKFGFVETQFFLFFRNPDSYGDLEDEPDDQAGDEDEDADRDNPQKL